QEIGERLGISLPMVKKNLMNALALMRERLKESGVGTGLDPQRRYCVEALVAGAREESNVVPLGGDSNFGWKAGGSGERDSGPWRRPSWCCSSWARSRFGWGFPSMTCR